MSDWKARLAAGIKASGKSQREVSLAAGMGPGYVHSLLKENKDPTVDHLLRVCDAAGISLYYVLSGVQIGRDTEEIIQILEASSEATRGGLLQVLRDQRSTGSAE